MKLRDKLTLIISSCENYSDLWDNHMELLNQNWPDRDISTIIVTDSQHDGVIEGCDIYSAGQGLEMPQRIKSFLFNVKTEYVLITLDDYYVIKTVDSNKIMRAIKLMDEASLDYLRFWPYPHEKGRKEFSKKAYWIELNGNYKVNLYPGIWRKDFLESTLKDELSAWKYEVSLTSIAKNYGAKCAYSLNGEFPILDVIRKGKLLHPAKRYLDKHGMKLDREVISYPLEIKLNLLYYAKEIVPKPILRALKKVMVKKGYKFYSEGM